MESFIIHKNVIESPIFTWQRHEQLSLRPLVENMPYIYSLRATQTLTLVTTFARNEHQRAMHEVWNGQSFRVTRGRIDR